MDGQRIAEIYRELGFPSAPKFQTALHKQGINASLDNRRDLIKPWALVRSLDRRLNTRAT